MDWEEMEKFLYHRKPVVHRDNYKVLKIFLKADTHTRIKAMVIFVSFFKMLTIHTIILKNGSLNQT